MKLQLVEWVDAGTIDHDHEAWMEISRARVEAGIKANLRAVTVGFLAEETKTFILLAQSIGAGGEHLGNVWMIPKGWIRKRRTIK